MSNITELHPVGNELRTKRASFVRASLDAERWSIRKAAAALGMNHTVLGSRMRGATSFLAEELESIATLLKQDPASFYADYLAAGTENAPFPKEGGEGWAQRGSNPRPADYQGAVSGELIEVDFTRREVMSA